MKYTRFLSFRPAFDSLKQLRQLLCPLLAMSATLTNEQIGILKTAYLRKENYLTITQGVHRDNLKLQLKKYKIKKTPVVLYSSDSKSDSEDSQSEDIADAADQHGTNSSTTYRPNSMLWASTVHRL